MLGEANVPLPEEQDVQFETLHPGKLENEDIEPKNGGLVQMIFLFSWVIFRWTMLIGGFSIGNTY